jgi:hypothetical protein
MQASQEVGSNVISGFLVLKDDSSPKGPNAGALFEWSFAGRRKCAFAGSTLRIMCSKTQHSRRFRRDAQFPLALDKDTPPRVSVLLMFEIFRAARILKQLRSFHFGCGYSRATTIFPN